MTYNKKIPPVYGGLGGYLYPLQISSINIIGIEIASILDLSG